MQPDAKFVAYYRVSTKGQGASGLGIEAQREAVTRFLQGDPSMVIAEYLDVETGTRKGNSRPQLAKAIAHAKRAKATLVIAKLDRLARNVAFVSNLMESRVDFIAADNPHAGKLTVHIMAAVAEAEADAISKRTKEALAAARSRGTKLGTPANLDGAARAKGSESTRNKALREYAHVIPRILELRRLGRSLSDIARTLDDEGHRTRTGAAYRDMTVKRILDRAVRGSS